VRSHSDGSTERCESQTSFVVSSFIFPNLSVDFAANARYRCCARIAQIYSARPAASARSKPLLLSGLGKGKKDDLLSARLA
jgi:hypothetical protein